MPQRIRLALAILGLGSACSLLAPSDDSLLGTGQRDASTPSGDGDDPLPDSGDESSTDAAKDAAISDQTAGIDAETGPGPGAPCTDADGCGSGRYCGREGRCEPCSAFGSELTEVEFGPAEELAVVNAGAASDDGLGSPRVFDAPPALVYERRSGSGQTSIWLTQDLEQSAGAALGAPIDGQGSEGAPLKAVATGVLSGMNFFFRWDPSAAGRESALYGASIDAAGAATSVTRLPAPFNTAGLQSENIAIARDRAIWAVRIGPGIDFQLWTAQLDGASVASQLPLTLENGCSITELNYRPWATPDGRLLLITYYEREDTCLLTASYVSDIGVVALSATGQALGPVIGLSVNLRDVVETDASLSPDMCWLYFASSRVPSSRGHGRLFRARRLH